MQVSKGPKQLKGILKGGKSNITSNPLVPAEPSNIAVAGAASNSSSGGSRDSSSGCSDTPPPLADATLPIAVHISKAPKPPQRTSSSMNSKNMSEALHV